MRSPIDALIDRADLRCTICGARHGSCDCWAKCRCGWSYERGAACRNPVHADEETARDLADIATVRIIAHAREMYPEPMKHASGGFRKTLSETIRREIIETLMAVYQAEREAKVSPAPTPPHSTP